jgi:hypothetical protein
MIVQALGHAFQPFGSCEMICPTCGYVIWPVETPEAAIEAIREIEHGEVLVHCGGAWHVTRREPIGT